ncbi:MAG: hypothetical protein WBA74_02610 [Cyclobacteriaceae bacterium]
MLGQRPQNNYTNNTRTLPYFQPNRDTLNSRGFIEKSFSQGIGVTDFVFHMMASRVGIINTGLKTADIGSLHHRLTKVVEDLIVTYDGSIRSASNRIISYTHGGDGFSSKNLMTCSDSYAKRHSFADIQNIANKINDDI